MDIAPDVIKALASQLRDRDGLPPRQVVLAALALAGGAELEKVVSLQDEEGWTVVGLTRGGVAILETRQPSGGATWSWQRSAPPEGATFSARWYPLSAIRGVEVVDVVLFDSPYSQGLDLDGRFGRVLHLDGRQPVALPRDPTNRDGAVDQLVDALLEAAAMGCHTAG